MPRKVVVKVLSEGRKRIAWYPAVPDQPTASLTSFGPQQYYTSSSVYLKLPLPMSCLCLYTESRYSAGVLLLYFCCWKVSFCCLMPSLPL